MGSRSDHFDGRRFFNPGGSADPSPRTIVRMMREPRARWPKTIPVSPVTVPALAGGAAAQVTYVGHATFLIQTPAGNILTDPVWSSRASPVAFAGPKRVRAPAIAFGDLPDIAVVLLSHNHYDHCDIPTLRALQRRCSPQVVTALDNGALLRRIGIRQVRELDWWDVLHLEGTTIISTPARHFSARTPWDRNRALWCGFTIEVAGALLYFAGDSAYGPHFTAIGERIGAPDLSLIPIGAYEPRWFMAAHHMNPAEAVTAHLDLGSRRSVGMHFGTFQLTAEAIDAPAEALAAARNAHGIAEDVFRAPAFGETITVPEVPTASVSGG